MKKQSLITVLLTVLLSMMGSKALAYDVAVENQDGKTIYYNYINNGTELEVTWGLYAYSNDINIPSNVFINEIGIYLNVTSIGEEAFYGSSTTKSVTIPNSVLYINNRAFYGCTALETIDLGNSVVNIGYGSFQGCNKLKTVTIPNSVNIIGEKSFADCSALTSVTIGKSVNEIGYFAFENCKKLTNITSLMDNPVEIIGKTTGSTFYKDTYDNATLYVPAGKISTYMSTPGWCDFAHIEETGGSSEDSSFIIDGITYDITGTESVKVSSINMQTFSAIIPNNVSYNGSSYLVTSIGDYAFYGCNIQSITLPNSLTSIGQMAFRECYSLTIIISEIEDPFVIPDNVFDDSIYSFATLTVPKGKKTKYRNLGGWWLFQYIVEAGGGSEDSSFIIDGIAYDITGTESVEVSSANIGESRAIMPSTVSYNGSSYLVTSIGKKAFYGCSYLNGVLIPNSVSSIGDGAFYGCTNLPMITFPNGITNIGNQAFYGCNSLNTIKTNILDPFIIDNNTFSDDIYKNSLLIVPKDTKVLYQSTQGWNNFINIIEEGNVEETFKLELVAEKDWTGCKEEDLLAYYIGNGQEASVYASEEGIVISLSELFVMEDYPTVMILDGFNLEQGKSYLVRITAKISSDGQLNARMGRYYYNAIPGRSTIVEANNDYQEIDFYFTDYNSLTDGDAQILLFCGYLVGTTIVKKVQLFETTTTKIVGIKADKDNILGIYDLHGIRRNKLSKGLNIIKTKDGKTKKIYIK